MSAYIYPHTIENRAGERLTFVRRVGQYAGPGETVVFKPGEVHKFWNAGKRPDPFEAAFLARRFRSEFGMAEIPAPVQAIVFPVLRR